MLLAAAWQRLLVAAVLVAAIWLAVFWVAPSTPSLNPAGEPVHPEAVPSPRIAVATASLRAVVKSGWPAPGGGRFDRFDSISQPTAAPVNEHGAVAFHATVPRASREGIFLAQGGKVAKIAAFGDAVPGGGTFADFSSHPIPALNAAGHVAFTAGIAGGRATEGVFLAGPDGMAVIALAGDEAPGVAAGAMAGFETPALNDNDELAFVANVRRGGDVLDVLYFWNGQRLRRLIAEGELLRRIGGTMEKLGEPSLNNAGVVAFPATILKGPSLGGIFVAGARELRLLVGAGDAAPNGAPILRFSERVAVGDDDGIAFGAYLGGGTQTREAVLRIGPEGLTEVAIEGAAAPGGGRYAGFGPWPTAGPDGVTAFVAALDGTTAPLAAFAGPAGAVARIAAMGDVLPDGTPIGRFALNAIAMAGPRGALTFVTVAGNADAPGVIFCRCPNEAH